MTALLSRPLQPLCALGFAAALAAGGAEPGTAATAEVVDQTRLRVCADSGNLPYYNEKGEGFQKQIAQMIAAALDVPLPYTWLPPAIRFVAHPRPARHCAPTYG